jgi:sugar lactone lactonase YvrE
MRPYGLCTPRRLATLVAVLAVGLAALAVTSATALAGQTRVLINTFGSLSNPQGVAIDQSSGDVYVADTANNRVEKFDALGNFLLAFGADVGGAGVDTCTSELTCAAGTQGSAPSQFTTAQFLAVDNSGGPSAGDVYVADTGDNLVSKFDSSGNLIGSWGSGGQLDGSSTGAASFGSLAGVAVGATGTLYVFNTSKQVFEFGQDGTFASEIGLKSEQGTAPRGFAVDGAGDLFKVNGSGEVERFDAAGTDLGTITTGGASVFTLDPTSGDLYVAGLADTLEHYAFNGSGEVIEPGGSTCVLVPGGQGCAPTDSVAISFAGTGIAVSSATGDSYLANSSEGQVFVYSAPVTIPDVTTGAASEVTPTSATLNGTVNPSGLPVTECQFEYVDAADYQPGAPDPYASGQTATCTPSAAEVGTGTEPVEVHANVTGLTPGVNYHFRLKAENANGPNFGSDETFSTPPPPSIDSATVTALSASSANLNAKINPQGAETHYRFEYGTSTAYGTSVPIPDGVIPAASTDVAVSERVEGLSANISTYHWRVVASNASGQTTSPDHTFIYSAAGASLPDNRAYEMVTPPQKNGALIGDVAFVGGEPTISSEGTRVIASSIQCFAGSESCNGQHGDGVGSPYSFTRTSSGWVTTPLAPPASTFAQNTPWGYSADTGLALFSMPTAPFGQDNFYARRSDGSFLDIGPNTPPEEGAKGPIGGKVRGIAQAQTADFSHLAWETEARWPFDERNAGFIFSAYEYVGVDNSQPMLVGVSGGEGSTDLIGACGTDLGAIPGNQVSPGVMSADGRTVYFTALTDGGGAGSSCSSGSGANETTEVPANAVYARVDGELSDAHTVAISRFRSSGEECPAGEAVGERACRERTSPSECGGGEGAGEKACREAVGNPAGALLVGAATDGSKAFFASTQQLTDGASEDSHAGDDASHGCAAAVGPNGCNLYEYDFNNPAGHKLIDVSGGDVSGGGPRVQGVMALTPDGSHVYFVAKGVLSTAVNDQGQSAKDGTNNLYLFERDEAHPEGRTVFIAELPSSDRVEWQEQTAGLHTNVTPSGRMLVFVSHGQLTADDTSTSGAQQVFRYDAATGTLTRISIGSDGFNDNGNRSAPTPCGVSSCSEDAQVVRPVALLFARPDPSMSDDGSFVFFSSPVALAPGALEDVQIASEEGRPQYAMNVYEWHEGHVDLISDGRDVGVNKGAAAMCSPALSSTCLLGTDASGANVFFSSSDQLVPADTNSEVDYYDARVCDPAHGNPCIPPPAGSPPPCLGEACHGIPAGTPPVPGAPTATFNGQGNVISPSPSKAKPLTNAQKLAKALKACKKLKSKRKRAACVKQARRRYGPRKAGKPSRRATNHRRAQ